MSDLPILKLVLENNLKLFFIIKEDSVISGQL